MKHIISVSKMYKHRGNHYHRPNTKKHWHVLGYEYDDWEEKYKMFCYPINRIQAWYYKQKKVKKFELVCPRCRNLILCFAKNKKGILKIECPECLDSFKDIFEEVYEENS